MYNLILASLAGLNDYCSKTHEFGFSRDMQGWRIRSVCLHYYSLLCSVGSVANLEAFGLLPVYCFWRDLLLEGQKHENEATAK